MKVLSIKEEQMLLSKLVQEDDDLVPNCGSSRAVIDLPEDVQKELFALWGIAEDYTSYVVKVAIGVGGYTQSMNEINAYMNHGDVAPLAKIVAYGQYCEIMEKVMPYGDEGSILEAYCPDEDMGYKTPYYNLWTMYDQEFMFTTLDDAHYIHEDNLDDLTTAFYEDAEYVENCFKKFWEIHPEYERDGRETVIALEKFTSAYNDLEDMFGGTTDNFQIGENDCGDFVCYDYGFRGNGWGSANTWSSPISEYLYDNQETFTSYLQFLIHTLDEMETFQNTLMRRRANEIKWLDENDCSDSADSLRRNTLQNSEYFCQGVEDAELLSKI